MKMNKLIFILIAFFSISASAGRVKINWTHDHRAVDGSTVVLTSFNLYWGLSGQPITNIIALGPPALLPWKVEAGRYFYSRTIDRVEWTQGANVCFRMTALSSTEESGQSNQICKTMPSDPTVPVIIDIDTP